MSDYSVQIAGIPLSHPVMNAAGVCNPDNVLHSVADLAHSNSAAVMVGPITLKPRAGNKESRYYSDGICSANSMGWPGPGADYYKEHLAEMVAIAHSSGKPLFANIAGFTPYEYAFLAEMAFREGADLCELDLGCGNLRDGEGKDILIPCFDLLLVGEILLSIEEEVGKKARLAIKVSAFTDVVALHNLAELLRESAVVKAVTAINTIPNCLLYDKEGRTVTVPREGLAGLGGLAIKPIGLGQVKLWREALPKHIDVMGVGGVTFGRDVRDYRLAGATAVQVGTAVINGGPKVLDAIVIGYFEIVL